MRLEPTARSQELRERLLDFMAEKVYPAEAVYREQIVASGDPHLHPPVMEELKAAARERGLWNLFHPDPQYGPGLTTLEYAPLAEIMGRSLIGPEATNCSAPDTGNMEVLTLFADERQRQQWLEPLLAGTIRSAFCMTEPEVASADPTGVRLRIDRDGDDYVLNGRKWWVTNAYHKNCAVFLVFGRTGDEDLPRHRRHSIVAVPADTPGIHLRRALPVFGYQDPEGHAEIEFIDVRVPVGNIIGAEGDGFLIGQARLGPGRIHHCMRSVGMAERALELMCARASARSTYGRAIADNANIRDWIAESRVDIEMLRLMILRTAWLMDTAGNKEARTEIAAIKVAAPRIALRVLDRAIQVHGACGVGDDVPLAAMWAFQRTLRIADGPDEVHKRLLAQRELDRIAG
ncbi:acyl-CoA dehydrogenase family protein [Prauserella endophytica]|uniref:Acyl-CoA dehydrogenase n=1 Tax=Prauserella endophytica TaxID=1592324 RepID=A0ABY2RWU5_9PSEU|nr:acyl-CoA dehydrogenase family protein [Prauserella endophytica]PXY23222.1 acyl-CoA dehydrogenase [Prauserella coralliicola]TKG61840.1 acyl-CoA dehydrogenase [Prauserella endophytica]